MQTDVRWKMRKRNKKQKVGLGVKEVVSTTSEKPTVLRPIFQSLSDPIKSHTFQTAFNNFSYNTSDFFFIYISPKRINFKLVARKKRYLST